MTLLTGLLLPLAQATEDGPRGYAISWALILFCAILGLVVALRPAKRNADVRRPVED